MKKFVLPVGAGVVVFGVVTAFAASLNLSSSGLAAGNATVTACDNSAAVTYTTALVGRAFEVQSAVVKTSASGCDGMKFKVALTGTNAPVPPATTGTPYTLVTSTGNDQISGDTGSVNLASDHIKSEDVTGVAVEVTG